MRYLTGIAFMFYYVLQLKGFHDSQALRGDTYDAFRSFKIQAGSDVKRGTHLHKGTVYIVRVQVFALF